MKPVEITAAMARQIVGYNPHTGKFVKWATGETVGRVNAQGYVNLSIHGRCLKAHRVAFLIMTGSWPSGDVDHINGIRDDNRWSNLRQATRAQNMFNSPKRPDNISGYKGVSKHKNHWQARMTVEGKRIYLGNFSTPEAAHEAYRCASREYHGEFFYEGE